MWVVSQLQHGSTFHFTIRVWGSLTSSRTLPDHLKPNHPDFAGKSVLVVARSGPLAAILTEQLRYWGLTASSCDNLSAALDKVVAQSVGDASTGQQAPYNVVITDLQLPDNMKGLNLAAAIRKSFTTEQLPIVLMCAIRERHDDLVGIGNAFLSKPVKPWRLFKTVSAFLSPKREDTKAPQQRLPILLKDDPRTDVKVTESKSGKVTFPEMARTHPLVILVAEDNTT
jgi:DNA-binding response OmpR family regulator